MSFCKAWAIAVFICIFRRHTKVSTLGQPVGFFAAAVYLSIGPQGKLSEIHVEKKKWEENFMDKFSLTYLSLKHSKAFATISAGSLPATPVSYGTSSSAFPVKIVMQKRITAKSRSSSFTEYAIVKAWRRRQLKILKRAIN